MSNQDLKNSITLSYNVGYDEYQRQKSFRSVSVDLPSGLDFRVMSLYRMVTSILLKIESNYELYLCQELHKTDESKNKQLFELVLSQCSEGLNELTDKIEALEVEDIEDKTFLQESADIISYLSEEYYNKFQ